MSGKESPNNMLLKKVKIALALTTEEMLELLYDGGIKVTKGELGAILRNPVIVIIKSAAIHSYEIFKRLNI